MKYKITIILIIGTILTAFIYMHTTKEEINFLPLGDGIATGMTAFHVEGYNYNDYINEYLNQNFENINYYKGFSETDETITSLLNKITTNEKNISNIRLKQAIKNADIITISIGMDELNNYALKNYLGTNRINDFINKYKELIQLLRTLNDKKIYIISLYATNRINENKIEKINKQLQSLAKEYQINYIDIQDINKNKEYFLSSKEYYFSYEGHKYVYEKMKHTFLTPTALIY